MKTKKLKYPKDPRKLLERTEFIDYLLYLEENGTLGDLEPSFLAYYVVAEVVLNEVNNGGFEQYLSNSTIATLPFIETSAKLIDNKELYGIISDLLAEVLKYFGSLDLSAIKNADYCDEFSDFLSDLDNRLYEFDGKYDLEKVARTYYQNNIPTNICKIQIVKPRETNTFRYFVKNLADISIQNATDSFMDFLNEFEDIQWKIEITKFEKYFRIEAIDETNSLDLYNLFENFSKSDSALKMMKFEEVMIENVQNAWNYRIEFQPSGFDKDEFAMRYFCCSSSTRIVSRIELGYMNLTYHKYNLDGLAEIIINRAKTQNNILIVYEKDWMVLGSKHDDRIFYKK